MIVNPHFQCCCRVCWERRKANRTLYITILQVDSWSRIKRRMWGMSSFQKTSCLGCNGRNDRCYGHIALCLVRRTPPTSDWCLESSDQPWLSGPGWARHSMRPGRFAYRAFHMGFCIWSHTSLSTFCVAHLRALSNGWKERTCSASQTGGSRNSGIFYFRWALVLTTRRMWVPGLWQFRLTRLLYVLELRSERSGSAFVQSDLCCNQKAYIRF